MKGKQESKNGDKSVTMSELQNELEKMATKGDIAYLRDLMISGFEKLNEKVDRVVQRMDRAEQRFEHHLNKSIKEHNEFDGRITSIEERIA